MEKSKWDDTKFVIKSSIFMFLGTLWLSLPLILPFFSLSQQNGEEVLKDLQKNERETVLYLKNKGASPKEIENVIKALKPLNSKQIHNIAILLNQKLSQKDVKYIQKIAADIQTEMNQTQTLINKGDYSKALNIIITIKGQLEELRRKYQIDTREAEVNIFQLEKDWSNRRLK